MATTNVSRHEKQNNSTTFGQFFCSSDLSSEVHDQLIFISALNAFLSISAFLGNTLILIALRKESSLHTPSKVLLGNLATTDLCVGLISEPLYVTLLVTKLQEHWNICLYLLDPVFVTTTILCGASLLTVTAISVDRLLALLLRLKYRQVVTLKRINLVVITCWVVSIVSSSMRFYSNPIITSRYTNIVVSLCLLTSIFCYAKIFVNLRHHQHQVQDQVQQLNQTNQLNIARYRKAVFSALWLQFTLVVCYLPQVIPLTLIIHSEPSSSVALAWSYTFTLVFLNSSLNPILYSWKIEEVRQAVKDTIRQLLCC
ncbi:melanocyte-stimulating hormone receptor-like [Montipora foliosa]|uniref:melanocyte-stimulating hormone receptor-like n=1 Tax=Montipora foliosa TaxID=591990 RepID=UPI0035F12CCC